MLLTHVEVAKLTGRRSRILCRSGKPAGQPTHMSTPAAARITAIRITKFRSRIEPSDQEHGRNHQAEADPIQDHPHLIGRARSHQPSAH